MGHSPLVAEVYDFFFTQFDKRTRRPQECLRRAQRALAERRWADVLLNLDGCRIADPKIAKPADKLAAKLEKAGKKLLADAARKAKRAPRKARARYAAIADDFEGHPIAIEAANARDALPDPGS